MNFFKKNITPITVISIAFLISVVIRYPHLTRELGIHNENATAHVLVTLKSYQQNPLKEHFFLPIYSYGQDINKFINNMPPSSLATETGSYIYTSFSSLGFFLPYVAISIFTDEISVKTLRIFNLVLHFISTVLLYFLLLFSTRKRNVFAATTSSIVYLFLPEVMWSLSNSYWMHSPAQLFFILALIFSAKYIEDPHNPSHLISIFFATLILCLTEWYGFFFVLGFFIFLWYRLIQGNSDAASSNLSHKWFLGFGLLPFIALALIALHFSLKLNVADVLDTWVSRANYRSNSSALTYLEILKGYVLSFGIVLLALIPLAFKKFSKFPLLALAAFPAIENFVFATHSQFYTYSSLKIAVPLVLIFYWGISEYASRFRQVIVGCVCVISSVLLFYHVNSPFLGRYFDDVFANPGTLVGENLKSDEIGFVQQLFGHVVFYSGRHLIENCIEQICVEERLMMHDVEKGKIFYTRKRGLDGYDVPFLHKYYYGFHNGIVHSITSHRVGDRFGVRQTPINFDKYGFLKGVAADRGEVAIRKSDKNERLALESKFVQFDSGQRCVVSDVRSLRDFIVLRLAGCELSGPVGFPNFLAFGA